MSQLIDNFRAEFTEAVPQLTEMTTAFVETATALVISELGEYFEEANVLTAAEDTNSRRFAVKWSYAPDKTTFDPQDSLDQAVCEVIARCIGAELIAEFEMNAKMGRGDQKFAPYILLAPTGVVIDPETGNHTQAFMTRYTYR